MDIASDASSILDKGTNARKVTSLEAPTNEWPLASAVLNLTLLNRRF